MTEETTIPEQEVQTTVTVKGKTRFGLDQINNHAPDKWLRVSRGLKYFCVGMVTIVSGTPYLSSKASNIVNFCLAIAILILGSIDAMLGVSTK